MTEKSLGRAKQVADAGQSSIRGGIERLSVTSPSWSVHQKQYWIEMIERLIGVRLSLSHFSGYKVNKEPLEAWILREFIGLEIDDDLIMRICGFIFLFLGGHICFPISQAVWFMQLCTATLRGCTTDRRRLSHITDLGVIAYSCIATSADPTWEDMQIPDEEERGEGSEGCGRGDLGSSYHIDPFDSSDLGTPSFSLGLTHLPSPILLYRTTSSGHWKFFILGTSSSGHWEFFISGASSGHAFSSDSDEHDDEQMDVVTSAQQFGFGHHVGKKSARFTPFDWS
ncbi:hypothetical protein M9H77_03793 [Catharanthus roseus]|uniref:Uncharacterized protein n=1 Tax=Catharanthus roseus TaxID=4058 RepID=A0ACC0CCB3_CATRO|nr:hypothetical protein M9H77_03793 [Catharanthus roseus]